MEIGVKHKALQKKIQWYSGENGLRRAVSCKLLIRGNDFMEKIILEFILLLL